MYNQKRAVEPNSYTIADVFLSYFIKGSRSFNKLKAWIRDKEGGVNFHLVRGRATKNSVARRTPAAQHMYQYAFAASATVTIWGRIASIILENLFFLLDMPPVTDAAAYLYTPSTGPCANDFLGVFNV